MHDEVVEALLSPSNGGTLGALLAAVKAAESGDFQTAESAYEKLGLDHWAVSKAQVAAYYWACRINIEKSHDD